MRITLCQIASKLSKNNLDQHITLIETHASTSDVIIFPELSLNGYLLMDKVYEDAYSLDELTALETASINVDIIVGLALKHNKEIYNASIYFSEGKIKHIHYKNHLPSYGMFEESRYFFKGKSIEAFETNFGRSAMVICEDLWRASTIQTLSDLELDTVYVLTASPARGFENETLEIQEQWNSIGKTTALLANTQVVFVNKVGFEDGLGFWGGSCVINHNGQIEHQMELFESKTETFDLSSTRFETNKFIIKHH